MPNPQKPGELMIKNPLSDMLTGDYNIKVDISTALRPSKERRRAEIIEYLTWLVNPAVSQWLMAQGKMVNVESITKVAKDFGLNPESLLINITPEVQQAQTEQVAPSG